MFRLPCLFSWLWFQTMIMGMILLPCVPAWAFDTEIFFGNRDNINDGLPNVLFIIDTSGSMSGQVTTQTPYDPATTYSGSCRTDRIYWSRSGSIPSCSTSYYFSSSSNTCLQANTALNSSGIYYDRLSRWRLYYGSWSWSSLSNWDHTSQVECRSDRGAHGDGVDNTKLYAANGSRGPWNASSDNQIRWRYQYSYYLYSGNYLNWRASNPPITKTRLQIVQEVFSNLMDSISDIRAAIMRFDQGDYYNSSGGYFISPMQELTAATRISNQNVVNSLSPAGWTPLSETLYEATQYYRGSNVDYGDSSSPGTNHPGVFENSTYISPIEQSCQGNYIVLLTDGEPTKDTGADSKISALPEFSTLTGSSTCSGNCLDELAMYLYEQDLRGDLDDQQKVITYTIGFHTDQELLQNSADKGGGHYYTADDTVELTDVFTAIIAEILAVDTTFVSPGLTINQYNRLTHANELFFALFRPGQTSLWDGNLKKYGLLGNPAIIVDSNSVAAVDDNTGQFKSNAKSYWSTEVDGSDVGKGGAADRLDDTHLPTRKVYTYISATPPNHVALSALSQYQFHENNALLTEALLDIVAASNPYATTDSYRDALIKWARGVDVLDADQDNSYVDSRQHIGDPLHSKPIIVSYGEDDNTVFFGSNEGFIHAINVNSTQSITAGTEVFAFIPQELLGNLQSFYRNSVTIDHLYGMDGSMSVWVNDLNSNGSIEPLLGDRIIVYIGMRRGGKNYYALDVTDRSNPILMWMIDGSDDSGAFAELAQSWSKPIVAQIKWNGVDKVVLIFAAGYDPAQDSASNHQPDSMGRGIYIVDALSGQRLWWASSVDHIGDANLVFTEMTNSIPAEVKVVDLDGDGYADRMYVGDMAGQLWRFDINNDNIGAADLVEGGVIASFGGVASVMAKTLESENRRFYNTPDIAKVTCRGETYLSLAIGSGYRGHPLDEAIHERFYNVRDNNQVGVSFTTLAESNLYDASANLMGQGTDTQKAAALTALSSASGWYIHLRNTDGSYVGEKSLSEAVTFQNMLMFTTFLPVPPTANLCQVNQGNGYFYLIHTCDATPVFDFTTGEISTGTITVEQRKQLLKRGGIPPAPTIVMPQGTDPIVLVGPEKPIDKVPFSNPLSRTFWTQCNQDNLCSQ